MPRQPDEILEELNEQLDAISAFADHFEDRRTWSAKYVATAVHTLLIDGRKQSDSISIATQMGIRERMSFVTTADPKNQTVEYVGCPLTALLYKVRRDEGTNWNVRIYPRVVPVGSDFMLSEGEELAWVSKDVWWGQVVMRDESADPVGMLTRAQILSIFRNRQGGGHYDREIRNETFERYMRNETIVQRIFIDDHELTPLLSGYHAATMVQIGYEVVRSFEPYRNDHSTWSQGA